MVCGLVVLTIANTSLTAKAVEGVEDEVIELSDYIVSAGPGLRSIEEFSNPVSIKESTAIRNSGGSTLGEILDWEPGVAATSYAAGANRPVIRGFDGNRVSILSAGLEVVDVSATSPDHGVAMEPMLVDRVEVIRGPSTLLFGGSAIGGAVNIVGREIPKESPDEIREQGELELEYRYDSVSEGNTAMAVATKSLGDWVFRVIGTTRDLKDYEIPGHAERFDDDHEEDHEEDDHEEDDHGDEDHEEEGVEGLLENSFVESDNISIGARWFGSETSRIGLSYSRIESLYGVPGHEHAGGHDDHEDEEDEPDDHEDEDHEEDEHEEVVVIDMKRDRFDFDWDLSFDEGLFEEAQLRFGYTDYEHAEVEGDEVGTTFYREAWEFRVEASRAGAGDTSRGVLGAQLNHSDFEATGEEAFIDPSTTTSQAMFITERFGDDNWHHEVGARFEAQQIDPEGDHNSYSKEAVSIAASTFLSLGEDASLSLALQRSQRHPDATELYAKGAHLATRQYQLGDEGLGLETAHGLDLLYRNDLGLGRLSLSAFYTRFDDFIFSEETGEEIDELEAFQYVSVDAEFVGAELEFESTLYENGDSRVLGSLMADYVRATNLDSNDPLPRIPPLRIGAKVDYEFGKFSASIMWKHAFEQNRVSEHETKSDAYDILDVELVWKSGGRFEVYCRGSNLLDDEVRNHVSFLKDEAPSPGRGVSLGLRYHF